MKQWLGKRVLYTVAHPRVDGVIQEGRVERFSTSGKYVQIDFAWHDVTKVSVLEELPPEERKTVPPLSVVSGGGAANALAPETPQ